MRVQITTLTSVLVGFCFMADAAPLPDGTLLTLESGNVATTDNQTPCSSGSCWAAEVAPDIWVWTNTQGGFDGGIIVGKHQQSGYNEGTHNTSCIPGLPIPAREVIEPGELSDSSFFFGVYTTLFTSHCANQNVFSDISNDGVTDIKYLFLSFNSNAMQFGGGVINDYQISFDSNHTGRYSLDYSTTIPDDDYSGFAGVNIRLLLRGSVILPNTPCPGSGCDIIPETSVVGDKSDIIHFTPIIPVDMGPTVSCSITSPSYETEYIAPDCSYGTYQATQDINQTETRFGYRVTDEQSSAKGVAHVSFEQPPIGCPSDYPIAQITSLGGGQNPGTNEQLVTTFTGHITTTQGLTSGGKNTVKICPGTTVRFAATSTTGTASCLINSAATASTGTLAIGDKLICTNKPDGGDTDRFSIKLGL